MQQIDDVNVEDLEVGDIVVVQAMLPIKLRVTAVRIVQPDVVDCQMEAEASQAWGVQLQGVASVWRCE